MLAALLLTASPLTCQSVAGDTMTKKNTKAMLSFSSFDGGGPDYSFVLQDPNVVSYESKRLYTSPNHEELDGAGYTITVTFTGQRAGETLLTVMERSPIAENCDSIYAVKVDNNLNVTITHLKTNDLEKQ